MERRIAAIFVADMVGYSRLMEGGEADVLARQKVYSEEVFRPFFDDWRGRVVKGTGDGLLGVFDSVVDAVQCAVRIQREMAERETTAGARRIAYRIAVHIGEVTFDGGDIFGDGVNVAARLEGLAEPGGVVVSGAAHDMLKQQVEVGYRSLGEVRVKNIARPVRALLVEDDPAKVGRVAERTPWRKLAPIAALTLLLVGAGWWWSSRPDFEPANPAQFAEALPEEPSIIVRPFRNLTGDDGKNWLSEGLAENIISSLASSPEILVIGASTAFSGSDASIAAAAERVGVRYVLNGTIQEADGQLRVSAALSDAISGKQIWGEKWTRARDDLFNVQDEIAQSVLHALNLNVIYGGRAADWSQFSDSPEDYRKLVEGRRHFMRYLPGDNTEALRLFQEVVAANPRSSIAHDWLGWAHYQRVLLGYSDDPSADFKAAFKQTEIVKELGSARYNGLRSALAAMTKDYDAAVAHAKAALQAEPGNSDSLSVAAWAYHVAGNEEQAVRLYEKSMRSDRFAPDRRWVPAVLAEALIALNRLDRAEVVLQRANALYADEPRWIASNTERLAAIAAARGDLEAARNYADEVRALSPWWTGDNRERQLSIFANRAAVDRYIGLLREAGLM